MTPNGYYARGHAGREDDDPSSGRWLSGVEFPILDARALGLASASSRGVYYGGGGEESESEVDEEEEEEERRYGSRVRVAPVGGRLGSRQVEREEWEWDWEEQMEEEEERLRAR